MEMISTKTSGARPGHPSHVFYHSFRALIVALQAGLCMSSVTFACQVNSMPISDLPFEIRILPDEPGVVRIQLIAGTTAKPVQNLLGYDLDLEVRGDLIPGAAVQFRSVETWPARDGQFSASISMDPVEGSIALSFRRDACSSVSGSGLIGEIVVKGITGPGDPEELVRLSAGLVLEEIVNGARYQPTVPGITDVSLEDALRPAAASGSSFEQAELKVGPVPVSGRLTVSMPFTTPQLLRIHDGQGRLCYEGRHEAGADVSIDMQGLPAGNYWLWLRDAAGVVTRKKISKL